jgi:PAS domain S-box-containing protein
MTRSNRRELQLELAAAATGLDGSEFLRGILAGCGDCIKILDLDGRLQFMSEGGKRVMEVDDFSLLQGCAWSEFWTGEQNAQATAAVESAKAGKPARFRGPTNTAKGNLRYWDVQVSPIYGPDGKPTHLLSISRDITEEWQAAENQRKHMERQRFLTEELQHRVRNTLTMVLAIAGQTFSGEPHRDALAAFASRMEAINRAYGILNDASWTHAAIAPVIDGALSTYRDRPDRFCISGPEFEVAPRRALAIALAVNELATNALKYGALSVPEGKVEVSWSCDSADGMPIFRFVWRERGGPPVTQPNRQGFGTRVIKALLASDLGGKVELSYERSGVIYTLTAPLQNLTA